jgi:transposase
MERMPRRVYTQEFREQAVKLVEAEGLSMREAARRLSMPVGSLKNWLHAARAGKLKEVTGLSQHLGCHPRAYSLRCH